MATVNIRKDIDDRFYRYKMPLLLAKVEGKGNGVKTVITNIIDISKSLNRPPSYPIKFFGCELGSQVICNEKDGRYVVNGIHKAEKLQDLLYLFISKFVLCPSCKNPETDLVINRTNDSVLTFCKACGQSLYTDQGHKLVTFILRNETSTIKGRNKEEKHERETAKDNSGQVLDGLSEGLGKQLSLGETDDSPSNAFKDIVKSMTTDVTNKKLTEILDSLDIRPSKALVIFMKYGFDENILDALPPRMEFLKSICNDERCQRALIGGVEKLSLRCQSVIDKFPFILQMLYQDEVIDEDVILRWYEKSSKKYIDDEEVSRKIKESSAPFINWLKNADEEE